MEMMSRNAVRVAPGEGSSLTVFGEMVTCKVSAEQNGGAYSLFEAVSRPGGGPPPHIQHREDECFYVVRGDFEFLIGDETIRAEAGTLLYVSKGCLHAHKNAGPRIGRLLVSQTPGGLYEEFFEEIGEGVGIEKIETVAARYGIEMQA